MVFRACSVSPIYSLWKQTRYCRALCFEDPEFLKRVNKSGFRTFLLANASLHMAGGGGVHCRSPLLSNVVRMNTLPSHSSSSYVGFPFQ